MRNPVELNERQSSRQLIACCDKDVASFKLFEVITDNRPVTQFIQRYSDTPIRKKTSWWVTYIGQFP